MKVIIDIDLTPEEARKMMGLPDLEPLQQEMMEKMRERMLQSLEDMNDPEFFFKKVFPAGVQNMENFQNFFSDMMSASSRGKTSKD
ncbi:MAG: DUF6489 family protein [Pseudomonadales bacterium]